MNIETGEIALGKEHSAEVKFGEDFRDFATTRDVNHVLFFYMRIDTDGAFVAHRYFHSGAPGQTISPVTDPSVRGSLGWYAKDMAEYGRPQRVPRNGRYTYHGQGLSEFEFPPFYSYIVFFMDDVHWPYEEESPGKPRIPFHDFKNGTFYAKHPFAFTEAAKFKVPMTSAGGVTTDREAVVMINCRRKADGSDFASGDFEKYCFDLVMRVRYAGSTDAITVIIDPTGENLGPPPP